MTPLTTSTDLGSIWIERDGESIEVAAVEVRPLVRSLLVHLDALEDASD